MSNKELTKLSNELELLANDFANTYTKLINKFKKYNSAPEITLLEQYWDAAVGFLGKRGTIIEMIDYFILYKDLILASKVDELLEMDFTKNIKPGTRVETTKLIVSLIGIFKSCWKLATPTDQTHIKFYIQSLTTKAVTIKDILIKINKL